jgi:hypothetical protein
LQALAAMVRAKCGRLPHFDHTPPHTHHKVWGKCGGTESIGPPAMGLEEAHYWLWLRAMTDGTES